MIFLHRLDQRIHLFICIAPPILLGLITGLFHRTNINELLSTMHKPPFTAPTFLITFIWMCLYLAIGYATFFILESHVYSDEKLLAIATAVGYLLLHSIWVLIFFKLKFFGLGFLVHVLLLLLALITTILYSRIDKRAGILLIPFSLFTLYCTYLNLISVFIN